MIRTIIGTIEIEYDDKEHQIDEIYVSFSPRIQLKKKWCLLDEFQTQVDEDSGEKSISLEDHLLAHAELEKRVEREDEEEAIDSLLTHRSQERLFELVTEISYGNLKNKEVCDVL